MKVYGLTGGIGMGKSTVAEVLQQRGLPVVDTDVLARELVEPGQPALAEIRAAFGADVIGPDGRLRRDVLGRRVFEDSQQRKALERILHPRIRAAWRDRVAAWREEGQAAVVVVIPLLFETDAAAEVDITICVACSAATQAKRLQVRGWTSEQTQQRIRAQWPIERKMVLADYVIWNEARLDVCAEQVQHILIGH